jgi:hypothetical protein
MNRRSAFIIERPQGWFAWSSTTPGPARVGLAKFDQWPVNWCMEVLEVVKAPRDVDDDPIDVEHRGPILRFVRLNFSSTSC